MSNDCLDEITRSHLALSKAAAEAMFISTEYETADPIATIVKVALMYPTPEDAGTESSFHGCWSMESTSFSGEEKAPSYSKKHSGAGFFDKLTWTHDPASHVPGMVVYL